MNVYDIFSAFASDWNGGRTIEYGTQNVVVRT